jgi:hypothetical protein
MKRTAHIIRHENLHKSLDELVADFITTTERMPSNTTVMELIEWSHSQTMNPLLPGGQKHEE